MREMWAAEAEHPVFAGSLQNFKLMLGAARGKGKRTVRVKHKEVRSTRFYVNL